MKILLFYQILYAKRRAHWLVVGKIIFILLFFWDLEKTIRQDGVRSALGSIACLSLRYHFLYLLKDSIGCFVF